MKKTITLLTAVAIILLVGIGVNMYIDHVKEQAFKDGQQHAILNAKVYDENQTQGTYYVELDDEVYKYTYNK